MCAPALTFAGGPPTTRGIVSWPLPHIPGSDGPGGPRSLAVRGLLVFALGLAVACVARVMFMVWVYGCIGLIALTLGMWRAIGLGTIASSEPDRAAIARA
jgi:hypothetical protein